MLPVNPNHEPSNKQLFHHVPEHWTIRRIRTIAEMRVSNVDKHTNEQEIPVRLCNYVDVYYHDHINSDLPYMYATASYAEVQRFRLKPNDVLITKDSETWNDIAVPALVTDPPNDLICGYHLAILRPTRAIEGAYLARALQTRPVAHQFHVKARGITRYGLSHDDILSTSVPLPPLEEQRAIVRYLDHTDEIINRYISAKERLIALLEEQRQAFIHQAVTSGLDPNVPTKSSGIPWVGDVPQNWRVASLRYVTECLDGARKPVSRELRANMQGAVPYWGANSIIDHVNDWIFDEQLVLIGEDGAPFYDPTRDVSFFTDGKIWPNNHIHVLRCKTLTSPRFLPHVLNCVDYTDFISGSTRDKLTQQSMGNIPVQLPPIAEQDAIAEFLASRIAHTSKSISYANRQINLIQEYRTRLIADVVTGQIDVRDAAVELHV